MIDFLRAPTITEAKAERGITNRFFSVVGDYEIVVRQFRPLTDVQPGKDNLVSVQNLSLPPNANVETVKAWLHVAGADASQVSPPTTTGVAITKTKSDGSKDDTASGSFQVAVDQPVLPRNVKLQLDGGTDVWSSGGVLTEEKYELPDFSQALNAYLDKAKAAAPLTELKFVFKTDAPGKVGIEIETLTFSQVKTQSWLNPLDRTRRVDRNVTLAFGDVQRWTLDPLLDPSAAQGQGQVELQSVKLDVGAQLGPDRLLGTVESHDGRQFATISGEYSLAQDVTLIGNVVKGSHKCSGITCFFTADDKAELYVELQKDSNGYPASDAPLAKANLTFTPPEKKDAPQPWTFARFATPAELNTDLRYWIVVKGVRGSASLGLRAGPPNDGTVPVVRQQVYINRGGQVWKPLFRLNPDPPLVALVGVVYLPGSDDQTAAIQIALTDVPGTAALPDTPAEPGRAPKTISLDGARGKRWNQSVLEIRSHAQGTLSIANVIQDYKLVGS